MFVGHNTLVLNHSTVSAAIEEYLNARITGKADFIKVDSLTPDNSLHVIKVKVSPAGDEEPK